MNDDKKRALKALRTCRGQLDGIIGMIEDGRYCIDVSEQIMAAQAVLRLANKIILGQHITNCVKEAVRDADAADEKLDEIIGILNKLLA